MLHPLGHLGRREAITLCLGGGFAVCRGDELSPDQAVLRERLPEANEVMAEVRARLPHRRVVLSARIEVRRGGERTRYLAESTLSFSEDPGLTEFVIMDSLGGVRERLEVRMPTNGPPSYRHFEGTNEEPSPDFSIAQFLKDIPVAWIDLSLAYLWWPGPQAVKSEQTRMRKAWIVNVAEPDKDDAAALRIRLWVDAKEFFVLKAEVRDASGHVLRRIEADKLRKVDDMWMVEDLNVYNDQDKSRVLVKVQDTQIAPLP